jgi:AraC family transcriptional regulator
MGEPPGQLSLDGIPANVLMFNLSPVQALRQARGGRSFVSDMLRGEMTLMSSGTPSEWSWNSTCDRLDVILAADALGDGSALDAVDRFVFRDVEMGTICRRIYREVSSGDAADSLRTESLVVQLAACMLLRHSRTSGATLAIRSSGGLTRNQTKRVIEFIEAHLNCEVTLREMAQCLDLSPYHFARMFKRTMATAPYQYVLERRVERAKAMLRAGDLSPLEIGLSTGFCNQSHFARTFRRMVGATPGSFQRQSRSRS